LSGASPPAAVPAAPIRLAAATAREIPQRHGHWRSWEIAGEGDGALPLWRVERQRILRPCTFALLKGTDRGLMLTAGAGLNLDLFSRGALVVDRPFRPLLLRGEWPVRCELIAGPVECLAVLTSRLRVSHRLVVLDLAAQPVETPVSGRAVVILCLDGAVALEFAGAGATLARGEGWRLAGSGLLRASAGGDAASIALIEIAEIGEG
jgi:environmental stress-induced protein Ves